jgi:hypothetical protein
MMDLMDKLSGSINNTQLIAAKEVNSNLWQLNIKEL